MIAKTIKSMMPDKFTALPKNTLFGEAVNVMEQNNSSGAVVVEDKIPVGVITEKDIVKIFSGNIDMGKLFIKDAMSPVCSTSEDATICDAITIMEENKCSHLAVVNPHGEVVSLISQSDVIRHLKCCVENLGRLVEKERVLLNRLREGVCECDIEKDVINWINKAGAEIFGYKSSEDMTGRSIIDIFVDAEDKKKLTDALSKDGIVRSYVVKAKRIDNSIFYLEGTYSLIKDELDGSLKMEGIIRDVTRRKVLEYRTINEERLEAVLQIVRTARHEINNPLTGILGNLELMLEDKDKFGEAEYRKLKVIYEQSLRVKDVVQNMSTISKAIEKEYAGDMKMIDLEKSKK